MEDFESRFKADLAAEQAELAQRIGGMLAEFAARRSSEVSEAVSGMHARLLDGRTAIAAEVDALSAVAQATAAEIQVGFVEEAKHHYKLQCPGFNSMHFWDPPRSSNLLAIESSGSSGLCKLLTCALVRSKQLVCWVDKP